ncbi:hypothetical protein ABI59_21280 [Acidobacteria bacterium Mor1]|nr:hypothetical protein ABI59_21280 [Acidobacteria bacterium Mor1]
MFLVLALAVTSLQAATSRLVGKVLDEDEKPIQGAEITIRAKASSFKKTVKSNKKGRFNVVIVSDGNDYEIHIEREGYKTLDWQKVEMTIGINNKEYKLETRTQEDIAQESVLNDEILTVSEEEAGGAKAKRLYDEGVEAFNAGDQPGALAKFEEALVESPELAEAHLTMAAIYQQGNDHENVLDRAQKFLEQRADHPAGLVMLYDAQTALGMNDQATTTLDKLATLDKTGSTALRLYNDAVALLRNKDEDGAEQRLEQALAIDPSMNSAAESMARVKLRKGDQEAAMALIDGVLTRDPQNKNTLALKHEAQLIAGDKAGAAATLEQLKLVAPGSVAETFYRSGEEKFNAGRIDEAISALEQATQADPSHARAHYMLGLAYFNKGENGKAKTHFEKFIELAPGDTDADTAKMMMQTMG